MRIKTTVKKQDIESIGKVLERLRLYLSPIIDAHAPGKRYEILDRICNLNNIIKLHLMFANKAYTSKQLAANKMVTFSVDIDQLRSLVEEFTDHESMIVEHLIFKAFINDLIKKI